MGKVYGYVRALPDGQDVDGQIVTMHEMQIMDKDIFIDRQEDMADPCRNYQRLLKKLKAGDLLYMKSLDILGDDYGEIGRQWRMLTKEKKVDVVVLELPYVDTRRGKMQCGTLVEDIVLVMLEYYADVEWATRRQRQKEGIEKARSRGVQFGRPELPLPGNFETVYQMWRRKEIKGKEAAQLCNISTALFYRKAKGLREMEEARKVQNAVEAASVAGGGGEDALAEE